MKQNFKKYLPEIVTGVSCALTLAAPIFATAATCKNANLKMSTILKRNWKSYIPATIFSVSAVGLNILSCTMNKEREIYLLSCLEAVRMSYSNYKKAVESVVTPEELEAINAQTSAIIPSEENEKSEWFICEFLNKGKPFESKYTDILRSVLDANAAIISTGSITLDNFEYIFDRIDTKEYLDRCKFSPSESQYFGWDIDNLWDDYAASNGLFFEVIGDDYVDAKTEDGTVVRCKPIFALTSPEYFD